jgi:hypothetical protein
MSQLPAEYVSYLEGKGEDIVDTVRPILQQSAADQLHGVHIVLLPHGMVQAHLDDKVPYGTIVEDVD